MAYAELTATSPDDVIDKIATFASSNGWTIHRNNLVSTNRTLTLSKGTDYIHVYNTNNTDIYLLISVGYDGALAPSAQPNPSGSAQTNLLAGPYTKLYLFADSSPSNYIHVAVETSGGIFRHMSFGMMDKLGTWTGGTYVDGTYWELGNLTAYFWGDYHSALFCSRSNVPNTTCGSIRCDIAEDSVTNGFARLTDNGFSYRAYTGLYCGRSNNADGTGYLTSQFYDRNAAPFSSQVTLGTILADVSRTGGFWSTLGAFPNVRYLNIANFAPGQEITIGTDTWKVFPMLRKGVGTWGNPAGNIPYSNNHGYAFKKTA